MKFQDNIEMARRLAEAVGQLGGTTYYVGGYVRDRLQGRENKDVDMEVHGVYPAQLNEILSSLGEKLEIGESFGIYGLKGYSLDIAMPRKEENRGSGHRDFDVFVDPFIGTLKAAERRDFTINALMQNVLTGEIIDHFGGVADLERGIVRHVNPLTFAEDPLRVLRAAQFAARFGFTVAPETVELCRGMELGALPRERIMGELEKALLKSPKPSVFFETLREMNGLTVWFPEVENLIGVGQNPIHHAEGDVWTHTMMVLNAAVDFVDSVGNPLGFLLGAVAHDFGKAVCTQIVGGQIHAYNHETEGLPLAKAFMERLTGQRSLIEYVLNLVENHMRPNMLAAANASAKSTNKMFDKAIDQGALICLAKADGLGKTSSVGYVSNDEYFARRLEIYREYMARPYVMGRDLIAAGLTPGESFSDYLAYAHKLRLAGVDKESALKQILAYAKKH